MNVATTLSLDGRNLFPKNVPENLVVEKPKVMRTDTARVELLYGDEKLLFERVEGGARIEGFKREPLTIYRLRWSDDASRIARLMGYQKPVEVRCQPLESARKLIGSPLVYRGKMSAVRPDLYNASESKAAYWSVSIDDWQVSSS